MSKIRLTGVVVATVMPFTKKGEIDWNSYKRLLGYCATPHGITSVFVNGHAGEGAALAADERLKVIEFTKKRQVHFFPGSQKKVLNETYNVVNRKWFNSGCINSLWHPLFGCPKITRRK